MGGSPGAAECARRHADDLAEDAAEVVGVIEADAQGNLGQGQVGIDEQGLGFADAPAAQVLKRGVVGRVLERMGDVVAAGVEMLGNVADGEVFGIMLFDVRAGVFNQEVFRLSSFDGPLRDLLPYKMDDGLGCCICCGISVRLGEAVFNDVVEGAEFFGDGLAGNAGMGAGRKQRIGARAGALESCDGDAAGIRERIKHQTFIVHDFTVVDDDIAGLRMAYLIADDMRAVAGEHEIELDAVLVLMHRADAAVPVIEADEAWLLLEGGCFLLIDVDGDGHVFLLSGLSES